MSLKEQPYALPLKVDGRQFVKATSCAVNSCIVGSYFETPSIAWASTSSMVVDGEISVGAKFAGWVQKSALKVEWPHALSLYKKPGAVNHIVLFIYKLSDSTYKTYKVPNDAQVALMMGYERAVVVLKEGFFMINLFLNKQPITIPGTPALHLLPALCSGTSETLLVCAFSTIQRWHINSKGQATLQFEAHASGFGYSEIVSFENTIASVSDGGSKIHIYEIDEKGRHETVELEQAIPVTRLFIDEDYLIAGYADGTIRLFDVDSKTLISQLNLTPGAARTGASNAATQTSSPAPQNGLQLQHKISFVERHNEFIISAMLDPTNTDPMLRQLEMSVWPIVGQHLVQPLKTKLIPGTVIFVNFDPREAQLYIITQHRRLNDDSAAGINPNGNPLSLINWRPPFKNLAESGLKWKETNEALQAKLAQEVMDGVLLQPSFFSRMFLVDPDYEEGVEVVGAMMDTLNGRDQLMNDFIDIAIQQEMVVRITQKIQKPISLSEPRSPLRSTKSDSPPIKRQGSPNSPARKPDSEHSKLAPRQQSSSSPKGGNNNSGQANSNTSTASSASSSTSSLSTASTSLSSSAGAVGGSNSLVPPGSPPYTRPPSQIPVTVPPSHRNAVDHYFPSTSMAAAVLTRAFATHGQAHLLAGYQKSLAHLSDKMSSNSGLLSMPSLNTDSDHENKTLDREKVLQLVKIAGGFIDGLIDSQSKVSLPFMRIMCQVHNTVCAEHPGDTELRNFRRAASRVFLECFMLPPLLDPEKYGLVTKSTDELLHNLKVVSQLLQIVTGISKHKLTEPVLCAFVTEYSTKYRMWLLSRLIEWDKKLNKEKEKKKSILGGSGLVPPPKSVETTAGLIVTQFIIVHSRELLDNTGSSAVQVSANQDPVVTRIRTISESLLSPLMSMMAKEGTHNAQLATSLSKFGKRGEKSSTHSQSSSSDSMASSESSTEKQEDKDTSIIDASVAQIIFPVRSVPPKVRKSKKMTISSMSTLPPLHESGSLTSSTTDEDDMSRSYSSDQKKSGEAESALSTKPSDTDPQKEPKSESLKRPRRKRKESSPATVVL